MTNKSFSPSFFAGAAIAAQITIGAHCYNINSIERTTNDYLDNIQVIFPRAFNNSLSNYSLMNCRIENTNGNNFHSQKQKALELFGEQSSFSPEERLILENAAKVNAIPMNLNILALMKGKA